MTTGSEMGRSPEKSSFSLACRLLSQFIKDKRCPSELGLGMLSPYLDIAPIGKCEGHRPPTTMSLLPGVVVSDEDDADEAPNHVDSDLSAPPANSKDSENGQLTIFYGGNVVVFDHFPPEKAMELMQLASGSPQKLSFAAPTTVSTDHVSCRLPSLAPQPQPNFSGEFLLLCKPTTYSPQPSFLICEQRTDLPLQGRHHFTVSWRRGRTGLAQRHLIQ
ncbi:hypothetical protein HPP92_005874 [Vanilla planifolia]|uniref:Protein TIFY n=1 Tax=Vanilla planifolia TaxID=51239 RepID=A0A835VDK6_VANPL|nr:hypothetical protein HPP92_005874 [Vanilla planifolia]